MLKIDVRPGESVTIGDNVVVTLEQKSGQLARLAFQADKSIPIRKTTRADVAKIAASSGLSGAKA